MKTIKILSLLLFFGLLTGCGSAIMNSQLGHMQMYRLDAVNLSAVPNNVFMGRALHPGTWNTDLVYNTSTHSIDMYDNQTNNVGSAFIGGLYPCTNCEYVWDIGIDSSGSNGDSYILTGPMGIMFKKLSNGGLRVVSIYLNDTGTKQYTKYFDVPPSALINGNRTKVYAVTDEVNRTNTVFFNSTLTTTSPYYSYDDRNLPYPYVIEPIIAIYNDLGSDSYHIFHLYGLTQLVNRNIVTPIGNTRYMGFGEDYPRTSVDTLGSNLMYANGQKGTVFADAGWLDNDTLNFEKGLLSQGWELGIHFHDSLSTLSNDSAYSEMDSNYTTITNAFGQPPVCWCSLKNGDNVIHAVYAYKKYGLIWRNGQAGMGLVPNVGNLAGSYWYWWARAIQSGFINPCFTHGTDSDFNSSTAYDIDYSNFTTWANHYKTADISIIPFCEYYKRNANQADAQINILEKDSNHVKFTLTTNGYPSDVNVLLGITTGYRAYNNNTQLSYISNGDGSITIPGAVNGTYLIINAAYVKQIDVTKLTTKITGGYTNNYNTSSTVTYQTSNSSLIASGLTASHVSSISTSVTPTYTKTDPYTGVNTTALIGWWKFDETSGNSSNDSSGQNHPCKLLNVTFLSGKYNNAGNFTTSTATVDKSAFQPGIGSFTIAWCSRFPLTGSDTYSPIISKGFSDSFSHNNTFGIIMPSNTQIKYYEIYTGGSAATNVILENNATAGWHTFVLVRDTGNGLLKFWDNGALLINKTYTANVPLNNKYNLGFMSGQRNMSGGFDNCLIYTRAWNDTETRQFFYDPLINLTAHTSGSSALSNAVTGSGTLSIIPGSGDASNLVYCVPDSVTANGVTINNYRGSVTPFSTSTTVNGVDDVTRTTISSPRNYQNWFSVMPSLNYTSSGKISFDDSTISNHRSSLSFLSTDPEALETFNGGGSFTTTTGSLKAGTVYDYYYTVNLTPETSQPKNFIVYGFYPDWPYRPAYQPDWSVLTHIAWYKWIQNSDGSLENSSNMSYYNMVKAQAHQHGVKITLCIKSSDTAVMDSVLANHQTDFVNNVSHTVQVLGADGVNLDWEAPQDINAITGTSNVPLFESLMANLYTTLKAQNQSYHVSIDTPRGIKDIAAFKNANLSKYVDSDFLMSYDYCNRATTSPNSPHNSTTRYDDTDAVQETLKYFNRSQIILGIPFYGYDYTTGSEQPGASITDEQAILIGDAINGSRIFGRIWDTDSNTPWYRYQVNNTWHQVWYDDDESLSLKYRYSKSASLGGVGFWALGYENNYTDIWKVFNPSLQEPNTIVQILSSWGNAFVNLLKNIFLH